jgi:hypothetical protein
MMLLEVLASLCKCAQTPKRILFMANTDYSVKILFLVTYGGMPMSSGEWRVASGEWRVARASTEPSRRLSVNFIIHNK